jgi:hypothetical protein
MVFRREIPSKILSGSIVKQVLSCGEVQEVQEVQEVSGG